MLLYQVCLGVARVMHVGLPIAHVFIFNTCLVVPQDRLGGGYSYAYKLTYFYGAPYCCASGFPLHLSIPLIFRPPSLATFPIPSYLSRARMHTSRWETGVLLQFV